MLQLVHENLWNITTVSFVTVIILNIFLVFLRYMNIVKYIYSLYGFIGILLIIIVSKKMIINISYRNKYLYGFIIYCAILNIVFIIINCYFLNQVYRFSYEIMMIIAQLWNIEEALFIYIKHYNALDNINIKDDENLITFLSQLDTTYNNIDIKLDNTTNSYLSNFRVFNDTIINVSNVIIAIICNLIILIIAFINSIYLTHYFMIFSMIIGIISMNYSVYVCNENESLIEASLFLNKIRHMMFIIGFFLYILYQSYIYSKWLVVCATLIIVVIIACSYVFNERHYFYNSSSIPLLWKFLYGNYLNFIVFGITYFVCLFILYIEYMSLLTPVNPNNIADHFLF